MQQHFFAFVIGFDWVCFNQVSNWIYFHNPLYYVDLHSFDFLEIGFVLHNTLIISYVIFRRLHFGCQKTEVRSQKTED